MAQGLKTGGRQKGTPNKATSVIREHLNAVINELSNTVVEDLEKVTPKDRIHLYIKLLEYSIPKYRSIEKRVTTTLEEFVLMSEEERSETINKIRNGN